MSAANRPNLIASREPATEGHRANLLQRDLTRLTRNLEMVTETLRDTATALEALRGPNDRTVRNARRAIELASHAT